MVYSMRIPWHNGTHLLTVKPRKLVSGILAYDELLFGRTTYEMLAPYWSSLYNDEMGIARKLNSAPKYVVSTKLKKADWNNSTIIGEDVVAEITRLKEKPGREMEIEASASLVQYLTEADLIDEYRLLNHPIIAGKGKRFFKGGWLLMA